MVTMTRWKISTIMLAIRGDESRSYEKRASASAVVDAMRGVTHESAEHVISRMPWSARGAVGLPLGTASHAVEAALVAYARRHGIAKDAP
jgi:hypothetical protein